MKVLLRLFLVVVIVLCAEVSLLLMVESLRSAARASEAHAYPAASALSATRKAESPDATYPNCRFGVGGRVEGYDVTSLNIGWHLNFGTQSNPPHPNGAEYIQVIRLAPIVGGYVFAPTTSTLYLIMDQNPGSTWLIGNEPDSPWQDKLTPETYARAYHHLYYLIKQYDPLAQVGAGAVVQPTPLRFQYLDRVWNAYRQYYGEWFPSDLWNIHSYILREIDSSDPEAYPHGPYGVWGAYIPPGITATRGILYNESDMFSLAIFQQRLLDLRRWMADHGQRDKPLYITEYGELFPYPPYMPGGDPEPYVDEKGVPITEERVATFMTGTFGILLNTSDPIVGYLADANRLVQRWLWYSVSDTNYGGTLFDPDSHQRRPLGDVFYTYTHAISPGVDLLAVRIEAIPAAISDTGQLQTVTLKATISNIGNISITQPITVAFYAGQPPSGTLIGSMQVITSVLHGCAKTAEVGVLWTDLDAGAHSMYFEIDPDSLVGEADKSNNVAVGSVLITNLHLYLPLTAKTFPSGP